MEYVSKWFYLPQSVLSVSHNFLVLVWVEDACLFACIWEIKHRFSFTTTNEHLNACMPSALK